MMSTFRRYMSEMVFFHEMVLADGAETPRLRWHLRQRTSRTSYSIDLPTSERKMPLSIGAMRRSIPHSSICDSLISMVLREASFPELDL